jgi:hypothetical protein
VKEIVTDFNTAHKQNVITIHFIHHTLTQRTQATLHISNSKDARTTAVSATTTNAAAAATTTITTTMLTQHRKKATERNPRNRTRNYKQVHLAENQKRKGSSPTTGNRPQQLDFNCNNRYEQLLQLPDADNDDIMLTDGTDNPKLTKENSSQQDPKRPPIFVYGITNFNDKKTNSVALSPRANYTD